MAVISQTVSRRRVDPMAREEVISMILPQAGETPTLSQIFQVNDRTVTDNRVQIEQGLSYTAPLYVRTADVSTSVSPKKRSINLAQTEAFIRVTGESESGFKLEIIGAFKEDLSSAFFWG